MMSATMTHVVGNREFRLGNLFPDTKTTKYAWHVYGDMDNTQVFPRDKWVEMDLSPWCSPIKDQDGVGACNAFTTIECMEATRRLQGLPHVELSCGFMYGNINGGQDQGSLLEDAIRQALTGGAPPATVVPNLSWQKSRWPANAAALAAQYKAKKALWCPTFDHLASAVQQGRFVNLGVLWYNNYNTDPDGWLPQRGIGSPGGHSITGCGLFRNKGTGSWGIKFANHWTTKYGIGGFGILPESAFTGQVGGWWAMVEMTDEGGVAPAPANRVATGREMAKRLQWARQRS